MKKPVIVKGKSTNSVEFLSFLKEVHSQLKRNVRRPYLLLDNHVAHKTKDVKEFAKDKFNILYIPVASSEFNSIERLWSVIKSRFRHLAATKSIR